MDIMPGVGIKLAHVALAPDNITEIEEFFGERMIWLIEGTPGDIHKAKWMKAKRPLFFDTGRDTMIFHMSGETLGQEGMAISQSRFLKKYRDTKDS